MAALSIGPELAPLFVAAQPLAPAPLAERPPRPKPVVLLSAAVPPPVPPFWPLNVFGVAAARGTDEAGTLGVLPGIVGLLEANEAVKLLLNIGQPLIGRLLMVDALAVEFRTLRLKRDPKCPVCGDGAHFKDFVDYEVSTAIPTPA